MTLATDVMIDNLDEFEGEFDSGWAFAQPTTRLPSTAIKINKIKTKQRTTLNKVQGRLNPIWILLDNQST